MEDLEAKLESMKVDRDKALSDLHNMNKVTSNVRSQSEPDAPVNISNLKGPLEEANRELKSKEELVKSMNSYKEKVKQMESKLAEKEALIDTMNKELNSLKTSMALTDGALSERCKMVEELKAETERRKDSEKKLSESNEIQAAQLERANNMIESLRIQILALKEKLQRCNPDENCWLKAEVERLDYELRLQRNRTATDEAVMLRNQLRRAVEGDETRKRAMDELAVVISEVAMEANQAKVKLASAEEQIRLHNVVLSRVEKEANQAKEKLASTEEQIRLQKVAFVEAKACQTALDEARKENRMMKNTIDQLRIEAEEALVAWGMKATEFLNCITKEEDEKAAFREEKNMLVEVLTELEQTSNELREDTEKLRDALKESMDEAEMAKAESCELMDSLVENERRLAVFAQENERLRVYEAADNDNIKEKKKLTTCSSQTESKPHGVEERKMAHSSSKGDSKSNSGEQKELKKLVPSSSKNEQKSQGGEEKEHKWLRPSFSKKETKLSSVVEEKDHKKAHKSSHMAEEKEQKKIKKDSSLDKDSKVGNSHSKSICFDPKSILPIPVVSSKHKEVGHSNEEGDDDDLTDSIFDLVVESSHPHRKHKHRRTSTSLEDVKLAKSDEFEHKERPHLDDVEAERAGTHSTKKGVSLRRIGDLWKRKSQSHIHSHSQIHIHHSHSDSTNNQNQNLHQKEVTDFT